jgi:hypothetical protein
MPYNPSSAYPRHTTYTPPVFGRGFARGFNEQDWGQVRSNPPSMPSVDVRHALDAALRQPDRQMIAESLTAQGRQGFWSMGLQAADRRSQEERQTRKTRKIWNRAEYGDDLGEQGPSNTGPREIDTRTPEGRAEAQALFGVPSGTGGRPHSAPVNDRLGDIAQRVTTTSAMNNAAQRVLSGKVGGPMMVPRLIFGAGRAAARRRKGA